MPATQVAAGAQLRCRTCFGGEVSAGTPARRPLPLVAPAVVVQPLHQQQMTRSLQHTFPYTMMEW